MGPTGPFGITGSQSVTYATGLQRNTGATEPTGIKAFEQINSIIANADLKKNEQTQITLIQ